MTVLIDHDIQELAGSINLIVDFNESSLEGASYDMRLGPQYIKHGMIETLTDQKPTLVLLPGEFAILRSLEELNMPLNIIGHNGIMSPWAKRGLVSLFSPQIDPGFCGFLVVPVFNAGDAPISINYQQKIFTVEFVKTMREASFGWSNKHGRQDHLEVPATPSHIRPNLFDIEALQKNFAAIQTRFGNIESQQLAVNSEFKVIQARLEDARNARMFRLTIWGLIITIIALIAGVIMGVAGSDWLRTQAAGLFSNTVVPADAEKPK